MKFVYISLCTNGIMKDQFISYCKKFTKYAEVYCVTNDNITNDQLNAVKTLNVSFKRNKPWTYFSLKKKALIKKFIKEVNPDFVFINTPHPVNIAIARYVKKYRTIFYVHDPIPHSGTGLLDRIVLKKQLKIYYKKAYRLVVGGEKLKQDILDTSKKVNPNKIFSIPFAFVDNFQEEKCEKKKDIDFLFFGRIEYYKGLDVLADSLKICKNKPKVLLVGNGDYKKAYKRELVFPDNVEIVNRYVGDDELVSFLQRSKCVILPYRDATGSVTIALAYHFGVPVIATSVGVFPEYVDNGGLIIKPEDSKELADAIDSFSNEELLAKYRKNVPAIYKEKFDLDTTIEKFISFFYSIIE